MMQTPTDDQPGFVAKKPEHCFGCYRLIRPGQLYYLTIEHELLCADCALTEGVSRVRDDLAVEVRRDWLLVQRGIWRRGWGLDLWVACGSNGFIAAALDVTASRRKRVAKPLRGERNQRND